MDTVWRFSASFTSGDNFFGCVVDFCTPSLFGNGVFTERRRTFFHFRVDLLTRQAKYFLTQTELALLLVNPYPIKYTHFSAHKWNICWSTISDCLSWDFLTNRWLFAKQKVWRRLHCVLNPLFACHCLVYLFGYHHSSRKRGNKEMFNICP